MESFHSKSCEGEECRICGEPAGHKVEETIMHDDPNQMRHPLVAYLCCHHFAVVVGPFALSCQPVQDRMVRGPLRHTDWRGVAAEYRQQLELDGYVDVFFDGVVERHSKPRRRAP